MLGSHWERCPTTKSLTPLLKNSIVDEKLLTSTNYDEVLPTILIHGLQVDQGPVNENPNIYSIRVSKCQIANLFHHHTNCGAFFFIQNSGCSELLNITHPPQAMKKALQVEHMGAVRQKGWSSNCLKASIVKTHSLKDLESNGMVAVVLRVDPYLFMYNIYIYIYWLEISISYRWKNRCQCKTHNLRDHRSTKNMQFDTSEMFWNRALHSISVE